MLLMQVLPQVLGQSVYGPDYIPPNPNHTLPVWLNPPKFAKVASCAVDIGTSMIFLGHAGSSINAAVATCKPQDCSIEGLTGDEKERMKKQCSERKASCVASISGVVVGIGYAAGFLSQAAADCKSSLQVVNLEAVKQAACAADIATFVASLALLGNSAASAVDTCDGNLPSAVDRLADNTRRLQTDWNKVANPDAQPGAETQLQQETEAQLQQELQNNVLRHQIHSPFEANNITLKERSGEITMCFFDVGQATFLLAKAGLELNAAVADCSRFELRTGGQHARAKCETDVKRVISSFAFVASGISYASFHCPFWKAVAPACAGAIGNMIASLSEIAAVSTSFHATCGHVERRDVTKLQPTERRLAKENRFV